MSEPSPAPAGHDCPLKQACDAASPDACREEACAAEHGGQHVPLRETLRRFDREADQGVCDTGRYRCAFFTWGVGPPLLFIPGLSDGAPSFIPVSGLLASRFRCIAYDLPAGRGDGARLGQYRHGDLVQDAVALLDHLGVRQSYLFGSSFGCTVALAALEARPGRFPRAILQGGFARRRLARAEAGLARLLRHAPGRMGMLPLRRAILRRHHAGPFAGRPPEDWDYFVARWNAAPIAAVARRALLLHRLDLRPLLGRIHQPVLLAYGDGDPLVSRSCMDELLHGLQNAVRIELNNCGHNPLFTHPEVLADVAGHFLTPPAPAATFDARAEMI
jgi:pimeloyl-ACP methyl ester carboxylesterase